MPGAGSHIACPKCGIQLNDYERRHRAVWQWALFPNSRSINASIVGKKPLFSIPTSTSLKTPLLQQVRRQSRGWLAKPSQDKG